MTKDTKTNPPAEVPLGQASRPIGSTHAAIGAATLTDARKES